MHLLVTRPEPDATLTAGRLRALGHAATVEPMLTIAFNDPPPGLPDPAAIVITSRNGLRALLRWAEAAAWRDRTVFAVGRATAAAARDAGFRDVRQGSGDARGLGALIRAGLAPNAGPILYPAARERSGSLPGALAVPGYDLRTVEAYRALPATSFAPVTRSLLVTGAIGGALIYSRRTATALRTVAATEDLDPTVADLAVFAISAQAAEPLSGFSATIRIAAEPTEEGLFALLPPPGQPRMAEPR